MSDELPDNLEKYVREELGSKRKVLEALAELDNALSEDAEKALEILREEDQE